MKVLNELYTVRKITDIAIKICRFVLMFCSILHLNGESVAVVVLGLAAFYLQGCLKLFKEHI